MLSIWKYTLKPRIEIEMPIGAKILCVSEQFGEAQLWALVNPNSSKEVRKFVSYGTGHQIEKDPGIYIGSFQLNGGAFVFHVFEEAQ